MNNITQLITGSITLCLLFTHTELAAFNSEQFQWKVFTNRSSIQGLSLLNQEKTLWVSTNGGLEERNGQTGELIKVFTHVSILPVSDGQGGEWGITRHAQLVHRNQAGEWQVFSQDNPGLPNSPVNSLVSNPNWQANDWPALWVGTQRGVVQLLNWSNLGNLSGWAVFDMNNSPLPDNFVRVLVGDNHGGVWLETRNGDYVHLSGKDHWSEMQWTIVETTRQNLPEPPTSLFAGDENGGLWLYGGNSNIDAPLIYLSSEGQLTVHKPFTDNSYGNTIAALLNDDQGGLWVGNTLYWGQTNFVNYLSASGEWTPYNFPIPETYWFSTQVFSPTSSGGLWVGTTGHGLYYLNPQREWQTDKPTLPPNTDWMNVAALAGDSQGGVWVGSLYGQGLFHLTANNEWQGFDSGLPNTYIQYLASDGIGGIWLLLPQGMAHLSPQDEWIVLDAQNSNLPPDWSYSEYWVNDGNGGLCAGEAARHLYFTTQEVKVFSTQDQLPSQCLDNLTRPQSPDYVSDGQGGWWEKVYNGLAHQNSQGQRQVFNTTNSPLPSSQINALLSDGEGGAWLGCGDDSQSGGLVHLSQDYQWVVFTTGNSELPNNYVESLESDYRGGLWIKTYDGTAHRLAHLSVQQPKVSLPSLGLETVANSAFAGGVAVNGQSYQTPVTVTSSDNLTITGEITINPKHVGLMSNLVVYVAVLRGAETLFVMLDKNSGLSVWDQQPNHLVAFKDNVILQAQQTVSIYQGHLSIDGLKQIFFGYQLPDSTVIVNPTPIEIQVSLGLPTLGVGDSVDAANLHLSTTTAFSGGISVNAQPYQTTVVQKLTDEVQLTGSITIDPADVGQLADLVVYAETGLPWSTTPSYFMVGEGLNILPWDQQNAHLVPFQRNVTLSATQPVSIYQGRFYYPGGLKIFFGYRLANGSTVVNTQPVNISLVE